MKLRRTWLLLILLMLVVGTSMYSAEPASGQEASEDAAPKPDPQIAKWISQLDSDQFKVREQATQALTKAGLKVLPAVLKATESKRAEVRYRAFVILFAMSKSDDKPTAIAVGTAAKEMLQSRDRLRVAQARKILEPLRIRARQIFLKLGARFDKPGSIRFSGSRATDEHMVHLKYLTNLRSLSLNESSVTDAGLEHLKGLKNLRRLDLAYTNVTDAGLEHLKGMKSLKYLGLTGTDVTDAGLEHLKGLTKLYVLELWNTNVTDAGLEHLKGLTNLQTLRLGFTKVTDAGLEHLQGLTKLSALGLKKTKVTDAGVEHLGGLTNLQTLYLSDTNVTDAGVAKLQQMLPNCEILH